MAPRLTSVSRIGAQGGGDIVTSEVKKRLRQKLKHLYRAGALREGDLASYLQDFDQQKIDLNFEEIRGSQTRIFLRGNNPAHTLSPPLNAAETVHAFDVAFNAALNVFRRVARRIIQLSNINIAVLFCGGSPQNPGLHSILDADMETLQGEARKCGLFVTHSSLYRREPNW